ncbi:aspartate/glutamate racemase family protein [Nonomuraea sp. NPDC050786]|uniref:aspartate/glutamate racemase family protein n=1 Tax=Nonomuraea sp. NPDC050786 TaxID=3154840 RepID=UPI0033C8214A
MNVLGVLGGMGPLASAEFLKTLYETNLRTPEQDMPRVLLDSDPAFPDRTSAVGGPAAPELGRRLDRSLGELLSRGASALVMACFTAHHFLPLVRPAVRARVTSLVDLTVAGLERAEGKHLMLCTRGTRDTRLFEDAPGWGGVAHRVALPVESDQELVHRLIYRLKADGDRAEAAAEVDRLRRRYGCSGVVLGCTEFHLIARPLADRCGDGNVVDALRTVARTLPALLTTPREELRHAG